MVDYVWLPVVFVAGVFSGVNIMYFMWYPSVLEVIKNELVAIHSKLSCITVR